MKLKCRPTYTPLHGSLLPGRLRYVLRLYYVRVLMRLSGAQSPFARFRCYPSRRDFQNLVSGHYPAFVAHTGSCADPKPSSSLGKPSYPRSLQVAVSPCWESDLPGVISANLSSRAWTPTPAALVVHLPVSSHKTTAFPTLGLGRRFAKPLQQFQ